MNTPAVRIDIAPPVRPGPTPPQAGVGGAAPGQTGAGGPGPDGTRMLTPRPVPVGVPPGGGPGPGAMIGLGHARP